jgi:hypothetical protein
MLPSVLQTVMADVTIDFLVDVTTNFLADITYDTVKRLKRHLTIPLTGILLDDNNIHDTKYRRPQVGATRTSKVKEPDPLNTQQLNAQFRATGRFR